MTQLKDLKPNKRNPRKITDKKLELLKKSLAKFGDLSGFVYNRQTQALVSGHQRSKSLPKNAKVVIERKYDQATAAMTVAEGYVEVDGEKFKYREVDASPEWEMEALLAANKHGGEWDADLLKLNLIDFPKMDLDLAGFELPELQAMNIEIPKFEVQSISIVADPTDTTVSISDILGKESEDEMTDEEYLDSEEKTTEQIDRERLPNNTVYKKKEPLPPGELKDVTDEVVAADENIFDEFTENIETKNDKQLIVIDCQGSVEVKDKLKEKLRTDNIEKLFGVKIF